MISQGFEWLSPAATQLVALALLHSLWQGVLVAVAVAVILWLLRDDLSSEDETAPGHSLSTRSSSRANLRYLIGSAGLLVMAALPVVNLLVVQPNSAAMLEVMEYLADKHRVSFVLDMRALDEVNMDGSVPISRSLDGISLAEVLGRLTNDLNLTWCVKDNVVLITTPREAWNLFDLRVYRDKAPRMMGAGSRVARDIVRQIQPESWSDVGGPGSVTPISGLEAIQESLLVVRQTHGVHRQIEKRCGG